jgi:transcriptional regulator GlxA family with amidase domain
MRIEIVVFDGFDELDAVLPFEVFRNAAHASDWDVALVGVRGPGEVLASHGMRLQVDAGLGRPDAVVVPGGGWNDGSPAGTRAEVDAAGLTTGRPATTHHVALKDLEASGAQLVDARVVDDGDLITCGGVTSGLDMALWMVERELGADVGAKVARAMECERSTRIWQRELTPEVGPRTQ